MSSFSQFSKTYKESQGSGWFNLKDGDNTIRILSDVVTVAMYFDKNNKRSFYAKGDTSLAEFSGMKRQTKGVMWVYDFGSKEVCIAKFPASVISAIGDLENDNDWGFDGIPSYNLRIRKTGSGMDTEYATIPLPSKEILPQEALDKFAKQSPVDEIVSKMIEKNPLPINSFEEAPDHSEDDLPFNN